ncbi:hypothetical protein LUZ60_010354 [Juncus effusus]|nr:hypothetical protein LUZ60_010354 [Juncus effusus]
MLFCPSSIHLPTRRNIPSLRRNIPSSVRPNRVVCSAESSSHLFKAAKLMVDRFVKNGMNVGLGSGFASGLGIKYLGKCIEEGSLREITGIPLSSFSATEGAKAGVPLNNYTDGVQIDFAFNDIDIIEEGSLTTVIGRRKSEGSQCFIEEKKIMKSADKLAFIIEEKQHKNIIDGSIPVVINSSNWLDTAEEIDDLFLGDAEVWRRPAFGTAGPTGGDFPFVTKEGHFILDLIFTSPIKDLGEVAESLENITGVVDHGIIFTTQCLAVMASKNEVQIIDRTSVISQ